MSLAVLLVPLLLATQEPTEDDWRWLADYRDAAFEKLMPIAEAPASAVIYRGYRDLYQDVLESYFRIEYGTPSRAVLVAPVGRSIQQQLLELHMIDRSMPFDGVLARVQVRQLEVTASSCPSIERRLRSIAKVRVKIPDMDVIVLHPYVHRIVVSAGGGHLDARLYQPEDPLVAWSLATLSDLRRCAGAR